MGKIRVEELAAQMGIGSKEVLFLLQSIGVDVKSPQAALDEATVLAILQGKTHAPKQLIVRDSESKAFRPQKSALSRIKIVEKTAPARPEPEPEPVVRRPASGPAAAPAPPPAASESRAKPAAELARTAVVTSEPEAEPPARPALPRKIVLPPPRPAPGRALPACARRVRRDPWVPLREAHRVGRRLRSIARLPAARGCGQPARRCDRPDLPGVPDRAEDRAWVPRGPRLRRSSPSAPERNARRKTKRT